MHQAQWSPERPLHLQFPWLLRATMRSPLGSPAQVEGTQGFLPQPRKNLERPSSTRLEARVPSHGSGAMTIPAGTKVNARVVESRESTGADQPAVLVVEVESLG